MVYIMLAEGFEEVEAITVVDLLRRGKIPAQTVSIGENQQVTGAHGICVKADIPMEDAELTQADLVVLPGGMMGTLNLDSCEPLIQALRSRVDSGKPVAAICAAPMVLGHAGLVKGRKATIYPGMEEELEGGIPVEDTVVLDQNVITSKGPGTAMEFGLFLIEFLKNRETAEEVAEGLLY